MYLQLWVYFKMLDSFVKDMPKTKADRKSIF